MSYHSSKASKASNRRILLYIFLFALLVKLSFFLLGIAYGGNNISLSVSGYLENLEPYLDFRIYYVSMASNFSSGLIPYLQFGFIYTPFFLYILAPFALLSLPPWAMGLPFVVFDAASVVPVFLIASKFAKTRVAVIASVAFAVAPINLFYYDFMWLNCPPMTFFTVLAAYCFLLRRYESAFFSLAIATLFKEVAIALLPVFVVTMLNDSNRRNVIGCAALYGVTCFIGSLPYIVIIPEAYLSSLGFFAQSVPPVYWWPYFFGAATSLAWVFGTDAYYLAGPFLLAALLILFGILCWRIHKAKVISDMRFIAYAFYGLLIFYAFFPHGIYKYYLATVTPFGAMLIRSEKSAAVYFGMNVLFIIIPRILTPWFLLVLLIIPLIRTLMMWHAGEWRKVAQDIIQNLRDLPTALTYPPSISKSAEKQRALRYMRL